MQVSELRDKLSSILASHLGLYTNEHNNQQTQPAIWVGPKTPDGWGVSGLECVIIPTPNTTPLREVSQQGDPIIRMSYTVQLKNWDIDKPMLPAILELHKHFPNLERPNIVPATDISIEVASFTFTFSSLLSAATSS